MVDAAVAAFGGRGYDVTSLDSLAAEIREASAAWEKARKKKGGIPPNWYSLFDGPGSVKKLTEHLHFTAWYVALYGEWSASSHGANAMARLRIEPGEPGGTSEGRVRGMRDPSDLQVLTSIGVSMAVLIYRRTIETRLPDRLQTFLSWYAQIRDRYARISDPEPLIKFREGPP